VDLEQGGVESPTGRIVSLSSSMGHSFSKLCCQSLSLLKGIGVEGDSHAGKTVQHRSRIAKDPHQPNLRQVHLIAGELIAELNEKGYVLAGGDLGENILTQGIDLVRLPVNTRLYIGKAVVLRVTGLRNPCRQIEEFSPGLLEEMIEEEENGKVLLRTGIMSVVEAGGEIVVLDKIRVEFPQGPHRRLERV